MVKKTAGQIVGTECNYDQCAVPLPENKYGPPDGYPRYCTKKHADIEGDYWMGYSKEYLAAKRLEREKKREQEKQNA